MKKLTFDRQTILFIVLAIAVVYYFIDSKAFQDVNISLSGEELIKSISGNVNTEDLSDINKIIEQSSVVLINWDDGWDTDPFFYISPESLNTQSKLGLLTDIFGTVTEATKIVGLNLTGISWHGNSGFAIINGQIIQTSDVISGYQVDKIALNYVILKQGSKTIRLTLDAN